MRRRSNSERGSNKIIAAVRKAAGEPDGGSSPHHPLIHIVGRKAGGGVGGGLVKFSGGLIRNDRSRRAHLSVSAEFEVGVSTEAAARSAREAFNA